MHLESGRRYLAIFSTPSCARRTVGERFGVLRIGAGHDDDRLGGGEPQVRRAHHDQRRAGVAVGVEGIQVRVAAPAVLRELLPPGRRPGPRPCRVWRRRHAQMMIEPALLPTLASRIFRSGCSAPWGTAAAAVDPQVVRELVEVPVGAGQQVLGGHGGARRGFFDAGLGRSWSRALPRPGQLGVVELRQVGPERVGVGVGEPGQRPEVVAAGAAQPLREHPRRDAQVGALFGLSAAASAATGTAAARRPGGPGASGRRRAAAVRSIVGTMLAPLPDRLPVVQTGGHHRELRQVHDRARPVGVEQRRRAGRADLRAVLGLGVLGVAERVQRVDRAAPSPVRGRIIGDGIGSRIGRAGAGVVRSGGVVRMPGAGLARSSVLLGGQLPSGRWADRRRTGVPGSG